MEEGGLPGRKDKLGSAETREKGFRCPAEESGLLLWAKGSHQGCERWRGAQADPWNGMDSCLRPSPLRPRTSKRELRENSVEWGQGLPLNEPP